MSASGRVLMPSSTAPLRIKVFSYGKLQGATRLPWIDGRLIG